MLLCINLPKFTLHTQTHLSNTNRHTTHITHHTSESMSSSLAPAAPPDNVPTGTGFSPGNVEIAPTTAPVVPIQTPAASATAPAPAVVPPVLPISPVVLPLPSEAPVIPPAQPVTIDVSPPNISPPADVPSIVTQTPPLVTSPPSPEPDTTIPGPLKPGPASPPLPISQVPTATQPKTTISGPLKPGPASPPLPISQVPTVTQPKTRPGTIKPDPLKPGPASPPLSISQVPTVTQPKRRPGTIKPDPLKPGPSSPPLPTSHIPAATRQTETHPVNTKPDPLKPGPSQKINPGPPIAASAVFPSEPPVALPVPQTPRGEAWFPSTSTPPSILPSMPYTTPAVENSPFLGASSSSSSSVPAEGGVHQNIEASSVHSTTGGGSSVFVVGLVVGGVLLLLFAAVICILLFFCRKKQNNKFVDHNGSEKMHVTSFRGIEDKTLLPKYTKPGPNASMKQVPVNTITALTHLSSGTFAYDELAAATSGFSDHNLLGEGGFGCVYKGVLPNGKEVAVKQLRMGGHQGEREFRAEVDTISQVHHKHLVSLVGYCISGIERLLVYEFVENNTLDFHLHGKEQPVMDWPTRLKIAIGAAKGLAYLHEDCSPFIIHRDIKAANILLDLNFEAKVSDFGLAKIFSSTNPSITHMTTRVVGTFGYLAPEYASSGKVTDKSDVYSYGVVLLELITGRTPLSNFGPATNGNLVNWARPFLTQAIADGKYDSLADSRLENNYNADEMASMVSCAAACVRLSSWRRPRMSQVIRALEGNLSASELDGGTKAGHSGLMHFPYESLDFDPRNYIEDMKRMALASSTYSDNTSEDYGLNLSVSSSDTSHHIC